MVARLQQWFTNCHYWKGVGLYMQLEPDANLLRLFKLGPTDYNTTRLHQELQLKLQQLQANAQLKQQGQAVQIRNVRLKEAPPVAPVIAADNPVYLAAKTKADTHYKEAMNKRARLFHLANPLDNTDPNRPDLIEQRRQLALDVVAGFNEASALYEKADHVLKHGYLPDGEPVPEKIDLIPDHLVKQKLDNLRKNYNKMKKREATPERVALLEQHKKTMAQLEERWHSLQQHIQ